MGVLSLRGTPGYNHGSRNIKTVQVCVQVWPYFNKATVLNTGFPAFRIFCAEVLNFLSTLKRSV